MAENSHISWTDDTFNPWIGCARVSPACDGCYAAALMGGEGGRFSRAEWGGPEKGVGTRTRTKDWSKPRKWNREQGKLVADFETQYDGYAVVNPPRPRFVFCASLADVFDNAVPTEWRRDLFDLIHDTPHLTWLLLTKRPGNILKLFDLAYRPDGAVQSAGERAGNWPSNAAIGCTVVTQDEADRDVPKLLAAKAALNPAFAFLSMEPLLGPVDLTALRPDRDDNMTWDALTDNWSGFREPWFGGGLDWVIAGGETDQGAHKARPAHPDWFRSLRDQCAISGVPFHFKQWGEWTPGENAGPTTSAQDGAYIDDYTGEASVTRFSLRALEGLHIDDEPDVWRVGKARAGRLLDGVTHDARPEVRI